MSTSLVAAVLLCLFPSANARAQFFPSIKEKTDVAGLGVYQEVDFPDSYLLNLNFAKEYRIRTWFSFGAEAHLYKFTKGNYSSFGIGLRPVTRIFFFSRPKFELFAEAKGGVIVMVPQYTQQAVNYTFIGSLGGDIRLSRNTGLRLSGGYNHFSNGKAKGDAQNPTWDGLGVSVSLVRVIL